MAKRKTNKKPKTAVKKRKLTKEEIEKNDELKLWIEVVLLLGFIFLTYTKMGVVGTFLNHLSRLLFGRLYFIVVILLLLQIGTTLVNRKNGNTSSKNPVAIVLIVLGVLLLAALKYTDSTLNGFEILTEFGLNWKSFFTNEPAIDAAGGIVGAALFSLSSALIDRKGTVLVIVLLFLIAALLIISLDFYKQAIRAVCSYLNSFGDDDDDSDDETDEYQQITEEPEYEDEIPFEPEINEPVTYMNYSTEPKIKMINLDEPDTVSVTKFTDEPVVPAKNTFGIRVDDYDEQEVTEQQSRQVEAINTEEIKETGPVQEAISMAEMPERRSMFMSVDELVDKTSQPESVYVHPVSKRTRVYPTLEEEIRLSQFDCYTEDPEFDIDMEYESEPEEIPQEPEITVEPAQNQFAVYDDGEEQLIAEANEPHTPRHAVMPNTFRPTVAVEIPVSEDEPSETLFGNIQDDRIVEQKSAEPYVETVKPKAIEEAKPSPEQRKTIIRDTSVEQPETPRGSKPVKPYVLPNPKQLLDKVPPKSKDDVNQSAAEEKGQLLVQALRNFDIETKLIDTHIGPSVTKFEIRPEANIKVSRILGLADDIKMQLAVRDVRIEAPIPGRNAVGVEVPNLKSTPVKMLELIETIPEKDKTQPLVIILGKDLLGNTVTCRLDKMPHLLIAGATGSGKSVCMNSIITSLLLRTKPDDVKLLLVDPKKVEFTPYQKIPHLIGPVINDPNKANNALKVIVKIMDERYDAFSKAGVRNIQGYNDKVVNGPAPADGSPKPKKMPYIVVIVDEMADLMNVAGKEVESSIQRITQLARAAGIHLIIATQRPSVDVITGVIKSNIPSRIAFAVSSGIDSRTILDHVGAERLLGNGDMLYMPIGSSNATRVQGVFITDDEVERITKAVSYQQTPMYDDAFVLLDGVDGNSDTATVGGCDDPLYDDIKEYVIDVQKASTSLLQRRFGIGYNRAARMIDLLEEKGIIGPAQGSKPRDVYIKKES